MALGVLRRLALAGLAAGTAASTTWAAVGGDIESVRRDFEAARGTDVITPMPGYELHEMRSVDGMRMRQYVDPATGRVFGVSWEGPHAPDVGTLLGPYAARYYAAAAAHHGNHHVLTVKDPQFEVTILRLPRGWQGRALLPGAVPDGVNRAEIR
jgi:hypothetical protein